MLFSIIIPVYNVEQYLRDCLESVLNQTFTDWEAICVNDGSMDGSAAILSSFAERDSRIIVLSQSNLGTAAARNAGLRKASGDYVFFLDSDDWLEVDALQIIARRLDREDVLCFSGKRYIEWSNEYCPVDHLSEMSYYNGMAYYNQNALKTRDFAFVCVVLRVYNRSFLIRNNLMFDDDCSYEDNLWVPVVLFHAHSVKVISSVLYNYRVRKNSKMQMGSFQRNNDLLKAANRLAAFFVPQSGFDKTVVYRAITHHYQRVFMEASKEEKQGLKRQCDWNLYRKVSCTKIRHRVNYWKYRLL